MAGGIRMDEQSLINRRKPMRLPIPISSAPLHTVTASFQPPGVPSLSYAVPRIRDALRRLAWIVARVCLLVALGMVLHDTADLLIQHYQWRASTAINDDLLRAHVLRIVARGDPWIRDAGETEEDFVDRRERFVRMCELAGIARVAK
jgi:hypothetical protein